MTRRFALPLFAALVLLGSACSTDPAPSPGRPDPFPPPINNPQISVLSPDLRKWLGFQPAVVVPAGPGPMQVQVPMRSLAEYTYILDYRFLFYDERGLLLEPTMSWTTINLEPKEVIDLRANSLDSTARTYRLEVRWAQ